MAVPLGQAIASIRETLCHKESFDPATSSREFRVSMSDIGEQTFLPSICEKLQAVAPLVRISAEQVPIAEVEEKMRLGQLDFAIGNLSGLKLVTTSAPLFPDQYACMTRKRSGLPARKISQQKFMELSHVTVVSRDSSHVEIDGLLRARGLHRRIALRVPHFTVVPQILLRTDWMVSLPRGVARIFNELEQFLIYPLPVEMPGIESSAYWHANFDNDEGNRWFRELLVETLRPQHSL